MSDAFVRITCEPYPLTGSVPKWMWNTTPVVEIAVDDLEKLYGPFKQQTPDDVAKLRKAEIQETLTRKIGRAKTKPAEPIVLAYEDFLG
jgi:hypothetical protein